MKKRLLEETFAWLKLQYFYCWLKLWAATHPFNSRLWVSKVKSLNLKPIKWTQLACKSCRRWATQTQVVGCHRCKHVDNQKLIICLNKSNNTPHRGVEAKNTKVLGRQCVMNVSINLDPNRYQISSKINCLPLISLTNMMVDKWDPI